jgi:hypothetical protein
MNVSGVESWSTTEVMALGQASDQTSLGGWREVLGQGRPELNIIL